MKSPAAGGDAAGGEVFGGEIRVAAASTHGRSLWSPDTLLELALASGASAELQPACRAFLTALLASRDGAGRLALEQASVWVRRSASRMAGRHELVQALPVGSEVAWSLPGHHVLVRRAGAERWFSIGPGGPGGAGGPGGDDPGDQELLQEFGGGAVAGGEGLRQRPAMLVVQLRGVGFLKLLATENAAPFDDAWFASLTAVFDRFAVTLQGCLARVDLERAERRHSSISRHLLGSQRQLSLASLAGGVAHDFNNMLTAILGHTEILQLVRDNPELDIDQDEVLCNIEDAAKRSAELCAQILKFAAARAQESGDVDCRQIVAEVLRLTTVQRSRRVTVVEEHAEELPAVAGDASQIYQVVLNLMMNAYEAVDRGIGTIKVRTCVEDLSAGDLRCCQLGRDVAPGRYVCVEVSDNGAGIDAATIARIFRAFFSTKSGGHGLGLAAVQEILCRHEGALCIDVPPAATQAEMGAQAQMGSLAEVPGSAPEQRCGTRFRVWLPVADGAAADRSESDRDGSPLVDVAALAAGQSEPTPPRVLVFARDEVVRRELLEPLVDLDVCAAVVADEAELLERLRDAGSDVDLLLLHAASAERELVATVLALKTGWRDSGSKGCGLQVALVESSSDSEGALPAPDDERFDVWTGQGRPAAVLRHPCPPREVARMVRSLLA
ncbi:MAG: nitrogen regulation protein NR(II) [Planctomycetota bacterium]